MWSKAFWKAAIERAVKTFAQVLLALLGTNTTGILSVDWSGALAAGALAALVSILTSLAGGRSGPSWGQENVNP